jgi:hypothetical protein
MAVNEYTLTRDAAQAQQHYAELGDEADEAMAALVSDPQELSATAIADFQTAIGMQEVVVPTSPSGTMPTLVAPAAAPIESTAEPEEKSSLPILLAALCVLVLVAGAFLAYMFLFRKKTAPTGELTPAQQATETKRHTGYTDYGAAGEEAPIAQFMASYKMGDDLFDDSFSIDSASGEFLGECGVGISETIGVGDHKKVTAFEVWLFDKNDIQTITKVLMSAHAFNDPATRQRLQAKGEPVLLESGIETVLETQTLQLVARVADTSYGNGAMPTESYFDHMLLELAVWTKPS